MFDVPPEIAPDMAVLSEWAPGPAPETALVDDVAVGPAPWVSKGLMEQYYKFPAVSLPCQDLMHCSYVHAVPKTPVRRTGQKAYGQLDGPMSPSDSLQWFSCLGVLRT